MKTITFYSYKGGVGRSLALSNIANKLSQLGKCVFVIDFDLEAPGLQFKFEDEYEHKHNPGMLGLVDYIYSFSNENTLPDKLEDFVDTLEAKNREDKDIYFLSAGNFEDDQYWKKLATIKWSQLFYVENSFGIRFFLDLKAKIIKKYQPDYLLIDSRTGITDISGITLKIFADEIVILAVNNKENQFGTKKIITSLTKPENEILNRHPKIHFVLTRLPFPSDPEARAHEYNIAKSWEYKLNAISPDYNFDVSIIHTDKQINHREIVNIGLTNNMNTITYDYMQLFKKLLSELNENTESRFASIIKAEEYFNKALIRKDFFKKLEDLNMAIEMDPHRHEYYIYRGQFLRKLGEHEKALKDFSKALDLKKKDPIALYEIGYHYYLKKEFKEAFSHFEQIQLVSAQVQYFKGVCYFEFGELKPSLTTFTEGIERFPQSSFLYSGRARTFFKLGKEQDAFKDIYKAIELEPERGIYFATLAVFYLETNRKEEFYHYLNIALSKNVNTSQMHKAKESYLKVKDEDRFKELLEKYKIEIEKVFE